jgi:hypothetical protein
VTYDPRGARLDVHRDTGVAAVRIVTDGSVTTQVRTFATRPTPDAKDEP